MKMTYKEYPIFNGKIIVSFNEDNTQTAKLLDDKSGKVYDIDDNSIEEILEKLVSIRIQ